MKMLPSAVWLKFSKVSIPVELGWVKLPTTIFPAFVRTPENDPEPESVDPTPILKEVVVTIV